MIRLAETNKHRRTASIFRINGRIVLSFKAGKRDGNRRKKREKETKKETKNETKKEKEERKRREKSVEFCHFLF